MFTDHEECGNGWAMAFSYMLSHLEFAVSGKFLFLLGKYWKWSRNCNWFISNINWIYWTYNATKGCKLIDIIKWKWILHNDDFPGINFINVNSCCCYVTSVMSDSAWPHRRQPTRLQHPWESPGKSTGVGCDFLLQHRKVESESEVAQSCPTLHDPMDCRPPGSSIHGIFQARVLEWVAIAFSDKCQQTQVKD